MNAKFRMPKFGRDVKWLAMLKELLMTVFATTVSIILTFGTAHYVDGKAKKAAGRQTAMMVIHDMEKSIETLRNWGKEDETNSSIARYVLENLDRIDSLNIDSLEHVMNYITNNSDEVTQYLLDESCERLFLSSQESWKNIDNASFIDAVHQFFSDRHAIFDYINHSRQWKKPVSSEAFYRHQLEREDGTTDIHQFVKERITSKEVVYYLNYAGSRQQQFNEFADVIQHFSDQCKFTMGITDEELEQYVKANERMGRNIKESELISKWIIQSTDDKYACIEFRDNHTFCQTYIEHQVHPTYIGRLDLTYVSNGTWDLRDDTLYTDSQPDYTFRMDRSHITPKPDMEKQLEKYLKALEESCLENQKTAAAGEVHPRANFATINRSGNKIELVWKETDGEHAGQEQSLYLSKEK
ncbi:MAG: hypothetical protein J6T64_05015 [Bacteroidaceae bacterium]|nr:hypothetical protein [Bacteroidaceae bacterium]